MGADDYFAIQNLIFSYPSHLGQGDFDAMAVLFSHADVYKGDRDPVCSNPKAVARAFREFVQVNEDGTPRTRHMTSNLIITPDGPNRAKATCYVMVFQQRKNLSLQPIIGGDYRDRFEKVNGSWRSSERRIGNNQFGNLSALENIPLDRQLDDSPSYLTQRKSSKV